MKPLTIDDLFKMLNKSEQTNESYEQDETPTQYDQSDEPTDKPTMLAIEAIIVSFLDNCLQEGKFPTLDEARVIETLDSVLHKYNAWSY